MLKIDRPDNKKQKWPFYKKIERHKYLLSQSVKK